MRLLNVAFVTVKTCGGYMYFFSEICMMFCFIIGEMVHELHICPSFKRDGGGEMNSGFYSCIRAMGTFFILANLKNGKRDARWEMGDGRRDPPSPLPSSGFRSKIQSFDQFINQEATMSGHRGEGIR